MNTITEIFFGEAILNTMHLFIGDWFDSVMIVVTNMGNVCSVIIIVPVLYWCYDKKAALRISYLFIASLILNAAAKAVFNSSRPNPEALVPAVQKLTGGHKPSSPGFPSGHSQAAAILWGTFYYYYRKKLIAISAIAAVLLVSYSRIYLGVHFLGDVLGAYLFVMLLLILIIPRMAKLETGIGYINEVILILLLVLIPLGLAYFFGGTFICASMGLFAGFSAGAVAAKNIDFCSKNKVFYNCIKILIGYSGFFLIAGGGGKVLSLVPELVPESGFVLFMVAGLWISFMAPFIFSRFKSLQGSYK
ncbi:MAG: phosphatase PAP2 family protein [bacterium]|nr:phosphatase PAP2 family protein [bacterium]